MPNDYRDDGRNNFRGGRGGGSTRSGGGGRNSSGHGGYGGERRGIPLSDLDPKTTEASRKVIGCSIEVHKSLGPGYDASIYMEALKVELDAQGVQYTANYKVPVMYRDRRIGEVTACLFVEGLFLVNLMARPGQISTAERMSLRAQLKSAALDLGLIVNFSERRLKDGLVRVLNIDKINLERGINGADSLDDELDHAADAQDRMPDFDSHN